VLNLDNCCIKRAVTLSCLKLTEALLVFTSHAVILSGCSGMQFDSTVSATVIALLLFCAEGFTVLRTTSCCEECLP